MGEDGVIPSNTYIKVGKTQRFALASIAEALLKVTQKMMAQW